MFGTFVQYGYDTAPVTGASLAYEEGKPYNPIVPAAVVKELDDMAADFKSGKLKVEPTEADAPAGKLTLSALLEMRGIARRFGDVRAVDGVDLDVAEGEIVGLLGEKRFGQKHADEGAVRPHARGRGDDPFSWTPLRRSRAESRDGGGRLDDPPAFHAGGGHERARQCDARPFRSRPLVETRGHAGAHRGGEPPVRARSRPRRDGVGFVARSSPAGRNCQGAAAGRTASDLGRADLQPRAERGRGVAGDPSQSARRGPGDGVHHPQAARGARGYATGSSCFARAGSRVPRRSLASPRPNSPA